MIRVVLNSTYELDGINPNSSFVLTIKETTFKTITQRSTSFSSEIEFAKTAANVRTFGLIEELNSTDVKPYRLYDVDVYDDDLLVFSGVFKLDEANQTFKGRVYGANAGLFDLIKGVKIGELDLSALNHTYTAANVNSRRQNTTGVVYPNINYGRYTGITLGSGVDFENFFPAVYIDDVLEAACARAGYTYDRFGSARILPFSKQEFEQTSISGDASKTTDSVMLVTNNPVPIAFESINNDPLGLFNYEIIGTNRTYIRANKGVYKISGTINYSAAVLNAADIQIGVFISGVSFGNLTTIAPGASGTHNYEIEINQPSPGTGEMVIAITGNNNGDSITIESGSAYVLDSGQRQILENDTIPIADLLPDMNCVELFKYVATVENALMISSNTRKTFEFVTFDTIAERINLAQDWSKKVINPRNVRKRFRLNGYAQENYLEYELPPEADPSRNISEIGRGTVSIDDTTLERTRTFYTAPFARTAVYESFEDTDPIIFIPRYSSPSVGINEPDIDPNPRVLKSVIDDSVSITISGQTAPATQCNPVFVDFQTDITDHYSAFKTALNRTKVIELFLLLSNNDIQNFDVTKPVFLLDAYWFVLKVDQFEIGRTSPTKVKLLRLY